MKFFYRLLTGLMALAALASCKEPAPSETPVKFAVYDDSGEIPKSIDVTAKGKVGHVLKVMAGADWKLQVPDGADWITPTPVSGPKGMRQVKIDFAENEETQPRTGRLEFTCQAETITIAVNQAKAEEKGEIVIPPVVSDAPVADLLDVIFKNDVVSGVVVNWTPVLREGMHVDPLNIMAKCVIDGTGHDSEMCRTVARKNGVRLATDTGDVIGERSLDVVSGEEEVVNGTKEIFPGLYVCGMAASAVSGTPRMGPIFGGMLLSGKKVADLIIEKLKK